jgi:uncharacterized membrane protein
MNWHLLTRASYSLLLAVLLYWVWTSGNLDTLTVLWIGPVVAVLPAVIRGSRASLLYGAFALIIPFCHGIALWLTGTGQPRWALLEAGLALVYFVAYFLTYRPDRRRKD